MIFRTITTDLDSAINKIGIFNKSFSDLKNAFGVTHIAKELDKNGKIQYESTKNGIGGLFNSLSFGITEKDISNIKEYNRLVGEEGVSSQTAWYQTMMSSSKAAQSLFDDEKNLIKTNNGLVLSEETVTQATNTITLSAKAATVATKAFAIAGNMITMWAISAVISKVVKSINDYIHAADKIKESAETAQSNIENLNSTFEETKAKAASALETYNEPASGMDLRSNKNVSLSDDEYKDFLSASNELAELFPENEEVMDTSRILMMQKDGYYRKSCRFTSSRFWNKRIKRITQYSKSTYQCTGLNLNNRCCRWRCTGCKKLGLCKYITTNYIHIQCSKRKNVQGSIYTPCQG